MDTPTLITIQGELPKDEVISSNLPPLLGPLPLSEENKCLSYNYYNVLELEDLSINNSTRTNDDGVIKICHYYMDDEKYKNKYIQCNSNEQSLAPIPSMEPETDLSLINMTHHQIAAMLNNGWKSLFGNEFLKFDRRRKKYTMEVPSGIGIYFCHSSILKILGLNTILEEQKLKEKYIIRTPEERDKFKNNLGNDITGLKNTYSSARFTITGETVTSQRFNNLFPRVAETLEADSNTIRSVYFFCIITFAQSEDFYTEFYTDNSIIELIPFSSTFIDNLVSCIIDYSYNIIELLHPTRTQSIKDILSQSLEVIKERDKYMLLKVGFEYKHTGIVICVYFNTVIQKFLGGTESIILNNGITLNSIDHNKIINEHFFKYPLYLLLLSPEDKNEVHTSILENRKKNIVALIQSPSNFITTQSIIKIRPSVYNKIVFNILDKDFMPLTEKIFYKFIFRFKREFLHNLYELNFQEWL